MTFWPLLVCTLLYIATAAGYWRDNNPQLCLTFLCYAGANVGFLWLALSDKSQ